MLPGLGFNEILILGVLALVVIGPKDLPLMLRKLGRWTARLRGMAQEFRSGFDELARQAELDELRREVDALRRTTSLNEIGREFSKPLPTLEDYAGLPKPGAAAAPPEAPAGEAHSAAAEENADAPKRTPGARHDDDAAPAATEQPRFDEPVSRSAP